MSIELASNNEDDLGLRNQYQNYPTRPRLMNAENAIDSSILTKLPSGDIKYQPTSSYDRETLGTEILIQPNHQYDLVIPTLFGLNEVLVPGTELTEQFKKEWDKYTEFSSNTNASDKYGIYAYYPQSRDLVRYMDPYWHHLALVVSNSELYNNQEGSLSWEEIRKISKNTVVAIPGCSLGNTVAFCVANNLRPEQMKIADYKDAHMANAQRVHWDYSDIGRNKAVVTAEQIHSIDPYMEVSVYSEGIHSGNIKDFVEGNPAINEPKPNIIVEETDDPEFKIWIREVARSAKIPVVMVSDVGSGVQRDIRRFDLDPSLSLAVGIPDEELYAKRDASLADPGNKPIFYDFVFAMIGRACLRNEFKKIVMKEDGFMPKFGSVPQLGSTAAFAGGWAAETVARMQLGWKQHERELIDINTSEIIIREGNKL